MTELNPGEVITIEDGDLRADKYMGIAGRPEYEMEVPVIRFNAWMYGDTSVVRFTIDDDTARRLASIINDHTGEEPIE